MKYPTVSVIVLSFNSLRYMEPCFTSLGLLDYPEDRLELVLADNASGDGSVEYVQEHFPEVRIIRFSQNHGFCGGNNRAASQSQSEFVAFLNPDMRVDPYWLKGLVEKIGSESDVVCASSKILDWEGSRIDFGGTLLQFLGHGRADGYQDPDLGAYDQVHYILAPCGGAMLIDRRLFLKVGGFDEDFAAYFEDVDLGWRLWILGHKVVLAPKSICYHVHFGSFSKQPEAKLQYLYERNALYTIIKNYEQRYLDRVLPLALLLQARRAYLFGQISGIDPEVPRFSLGAAPVASTAVPAGYDARYYLRETWHTLRNEGLSALRSRILEELGRRRRRPAGPETVSPGLASQQQSLFWIQQAYLAATNDVVENYAALMERRARIQGERRRADQEIFETVRALSFDVCLNRPEYRQTFQAMLELFGIQELFGEVFDPEIPFAS
jgi:GT2 family glycosyltransferase